ncbi:unnamed protein product [Rotaria sp. Silwood1]|nr:unnamed protein product [Rotaria sp. Silwood1]CAF1313290.1 unnamed protein product [Rotaria sp. Silwood1]CAF4793966.1 unnamed protein product [Rotaria sp. Silwood1]
MSVKTKNSKIFPYECRICGAPAEYSFFGVISCYACKMFFKRNANVGQATFICNFNNQCQMNRYNRHMCSACRLVKCFKSGMKTEKFRASRKSKSTINTLCKIQVQHQSDRLPTLNLLQSDQSLLTIDQWTLLTNLYHCYNESQILPFTQRLVDKYDSSESNYMIYKVFVEEFLVSIYETAGTYLRSNDDLRKLSSDDRSIILRTAADNVCCMSGTFIMQYSYLYGLDAFLNAMIVKYGKQVTWKYLLYKHGYYDAVKRYLNIILWLTSMSILTFHAQTLKAHINDVYSIIEQTELTLILDDVDQIIETKQ